MPFDNERSNEAKERIANAKERIANAKETLCFAIPVKPSSYFSASSS